MNAEVFIDTNILLYTIDEDQPPPRNGSVRSSCSYRSRGAGRFRWPPGSSSMPPRRSDHSSWQLRPPRHWSKRGWLFRPHARTLSCCRRHATAFQLSYWDAAILAAAKQMGCRTVYSEDLNAGQNYDGVTVINPFAASPTS
jgi:hypothetical protein